MWMINPDIQGKTEYDEESFSGIRAVSGHSEDMNVDHRKLFSNRQRFNRGSRASEYGGPENVYYYTDLDVVMAMRTNQGLSPGDARFGPRSRKYIYCTPVDVFNEHCPQACKHMITKINKDRANVQIVIDFK